MDDYQSDFDDQETPAQVSQMSINQREQASDVVQQPTVNIIKKVFKTPVWIKRAALNNATVIYSTILKRPVYHTQKMTKTPIKRTRSLSSARSTTDKKADVEQQQEVLVKEQLKTVNEVKRPTDVLKRRIDSARLKQSKFNRQLHQGYQESYGRPVSSLKPRSRSAYRVRSNEDRQEDLMVKILSRFEKPKNERPQTTSVVQTKPDETTQAGKFIVRPKTSNETARDIFLKRFQTPVKRLNESTHLKCTKHHGSSGQQSTVTQSERSCINRPSTAATTTPVAVVQRPCTHQDIIRPNREIVIYPKFIHQRANNYKCNN